MKKIVLLIGAMMTFGFAIAQDVLITKEGNSLKVWGTEIGSTAVYYREYQPEDSPIKRINKSELLLVKFQNGEKVIIGSEQDKTSESITQANTEEETGSKTITIADLSPEAKAENEKLIALLNNRDAVKYINEEKKGKKGKTTYLHLFAHFLADENSVFTNEDVEISIASISFAGISNKKPVELFENRLGECQAFRYSIKNKTNKTIFIDLGRSYFIRNGQASPYYIPTASTSSTSSSSGGSVNLGAITGALGVGGVVNTLASGVNIGGGNTNGMTNTVYSQRIVSIPPMSTLSLEPQKLSVPGCKWPTEVEIDECFSNDNSEGLDLLIKREKGEFFSVGHFVELNRETTPLKFGNFISYSFTEDFKAIKSIKQDVYLARLVALNEVLYWNKIYNLQNEMKYGDALIVNNEVIGFIMDYRFSRLNGLEIPLSTKK